MNKKNSKSVRCFVGIKVPPLSSFTSLREELLISSKEEASSSRPVRLISPEDFHLTVKFLGRVEVDRLEELKTVLKHSCEKSEAIQIRLSGIGSFKNSLWIGVEENPELVSLAASMDKACSLLGFSRESKKFVPHITMARLENEAIRKLVPLLNKFEAYNWGTLHPEWVHLFQSETLPEGAHYSELQKFKLTNNT